MRRPSALAATLAFAVLSAPAAAQAPSAAELEALYWQRKQEAQSRYTPADVRFMAGMIHHHAQALVMSAYAEPNGASPRVQTLAARIMNAQRDEIATMQRWLRDRGEPVPTVHIEGTLLRLGLEGQPPPSMDRPAAAADGMDHAAMGHAAMGHGGAGDDPDASDMDGHDMAAHDVGGDEPAGMDHAGMDHGAMDHTGMDHASMPGMLTQAQLDELAAAQGAEFDRLFLAYMIDHHAGAVTMVEDLFAVDGAGQDEQAFRFASDVQVDQRTEIARMRRMLDALPN